MKRFLSIITFLLILLFFSVLAQKIYNWGVDRKDNLAKDLRPTPTVNLTPPENRQIATPTIILTGKRHVVRSDVKDSIQRAIDQAEPGDVVELMPGTYLQDVVTKRPGQPSKPIIIKGSRGAVVKGSGAARIFEINHSYITLDGFTIDGLIGSPSNKSNFRDKLVYVIGKTPLTPITGVRIINMELKNSGGECLRFRYFAQGNEVANSRITNCGAFDFVFGDGGKNGEAVYIGTAPEQTDDKKNPTSDPDRSNGNWIHNNYIDTQGNECVDIKEGSSGNITEYNVCTGQKDKESGGFDSRGDENVFRFNEIYGNIGAGVRLGGDNETDGVNNHVYQNVIKDNLGGGIKIQRLPQGKVCGNEMTGNNGKNAAGSYGDDFEPSSSC